MKETAVMVLVVANKLIRLGEGVRETIRNQESIREMREGKGGGGGGGRHTDSDRKRWRKTDGRAKMRLNTT